MIIKYNGFKISGFNQVIQSHDFQAFLGFTSTYRAFEQLNLENEIKKSLLKRLSTANYRQAPSFLDFWKWLKEKHGMQLAEQFCLFLSPRNTKKSTKEINCMRNDSKHEYWCHIKARVYKKWCSILTEMQCVYAIVEAVEEQGLDWEVLASSELDAFGIDFAIVSNGYVTPIQIKKDSFCAYAQNKKNGVDNLSSFDLSKKSMVVLAKELDKYGFKVKLNSAIVLKYGLPESGKFKYNYLKQLSNGFVYFDKNKIVEVLSEHVGVEINNLDFWTGLTNK